MFDDDWMLGDNQLDDSLLMDDSNSATPKQNSVPTVSRDTVGTVKQETALDAQQHNAARYNKIAQQQNDRMASNRKATVPDNAALPSELFLDNPWGDDDDSDKEEPDVSAAALQQESSALSQQSAVITGKQLSITQEAIQWGNSDVDSTDESAQPPSPSEQMAAAAEQWDSVTAPQQADVATEQRGTVTAPQQQDEDGDFWDAWDAPVEPQAAQQCDAPTSQQYSVATEQWDAAELSDDLWGEQGRDGIPTQTATTVQPITLEPSNTQSSDDSDMWDMWGDPQPAPQPSAHQPVTIPPSDIQTTDTSEKTGMSGDAKKLIAVIAAVLAAVLLLAGGGVVVYQQIANKQEEVGQQQLAQREVDELSKWQKSWVNSQSEAKTLLETIENSPVKDDGTVKDLTNKLKNASEQNPITLDKLEKAETILKTIYSQTKTSYEKAMKSKAEGLGKALADLVNQAEQLSDAPDSDSKRDMQKLAKQWKETSVSTANYDEADKAVSRLKELVDKVNQEKSDQEAKEEAEQKAKEEAERAQSQQQTTPNYVYSTPRSNSGGTTTTTPTPQPQPEQDNPSGTSGQGGLF